MSGFNERRAHERAPYDGIIYWAPYRDNQYPTINDFRSAETSDLSREGFSFFWPEPIEDRVILISLKTPDKASMCIAAQVIHCHQGYWERKQQYRIGCKIAATVPNRLAEPAAPAPTEPAAPAAPAEQNA